MHKAMQFLLQVPEVLESALTYNKARVPWQWPCCLYLLEKPLNRGMCSNDLMFPSHKLRGSMAAGQGAGLYPFHKFACQLGSAGPIRYVLEQSNVSNPLACLQARSVDVRFKVDRQRTA